LARIIKRYPIAIKLDEWKFSFTYPSSILFFPGINVVVILAFIACIEWAGWHAAIVAVTSRFTSTFAPVFTILGNPQLQRSALMTRFGIL